MAAFILSNYIYLSIYPSILCIYICEEAQDSPLATQVPGPEADHCVINQLSYLTGSLSS